MRILRVYHVHMTPADTPGVTWRDIGPLRHKGGVMRPSELVLEFRISRGAPRFRGGTIIGRRVLGRGRLGIHFAEELVLIERAGRPDWLAKAVDLAATELATKVKSARDSA
jgi:hypothetical protein